MNEWTFRRVTGEEVVCRLAESATEADARNAIMWKLHGKPTRAVPIDDMVRQRYQGKGLTLVGVSKVD